MNVHLNSDRCPNCGYCSHCGRSNHYYGYPYYQPYYQSPYWNTASQINSSPNLGLGLGQGAVAGASIQGLSGLTWNMSGAAQAQPAGSLQCTTVGATSGYAQVFNEGTYAAG